jgi:hypothetical protein
VVVSLQDLEQLLITLVELLAQEVCFVFGVHEMEKGIQKGLLDGSESQGF